MTPVPKKGLRIGKALKTAAKLPVRSSAAKLSGGRHNLSPLPGELPIVILRVQVLGCKDLLVKDWTGSSDPFVVVSVLNTRFQTPVAKKNTSPSYDPSASTFNFPLYLSLAEKLGVLELIVWDKDMFSKDYLGELALPLDAWFADGRSFDFDNEGNKPITLKWGSTRAGTSVTGDVQIKLGFVQPPTSPNPVNFEDIYKDFIKRSRPSLVSAAPNEGIGTVPSHHAGPQYEDDGGLSSDDEGENESPEEEDRTGSSPSGAVSAGTPSTQPQEPPAPAVVPPAPVTSPKPTKSQSTGLITKMFPKRTKTDSSVASSTTDSSVSSSPATPTPQVRTSSPLPGAATKKVFRKSWARKKIGYSLDADNDIVGIVMLEIQGAKDLPRLSNMMRTGWDMDPFVVISFGKKVFRTRVIRHCRDPVWSEKLVFHVRQYEATFQIQLTVLDWDKLSSNDHIGDASLAVGDLLTNAPQPDPVTGLYNFREDSDHSMKDYTLPLSTAKEISWGGGSKPVLNFRAKFQPYDALRQRFWFEYLKQYDTDDTGNLSHVELTSMLDSLGSTLSRSTIDSFFTRNGKKPQDGELTIAEAIHCLETELCRPNSEKRRLDAPDDGSPTNTSMPATPLLQPEDAKPVPPLGALDFSGWPAILPSWSSAPAEKDAASMQPAAPTYPPTESSQQPLRDVALPDAKAKANPQRHQSESSEDIEESEEQFERVINVKNCPLCHRPRLNSKAEMDIVTHLAICASADWGKVDQIVVGNFVTANQAQRKWYTKVIGKISSGDYRLGANSANIIVQNRTTGQLEEEKMQVYVRLGIRLLYKGAGGRMEGGRARRLLKSMSVKQGVKYDDPASAADIPTFIAFHNLKVDEILDPLDSFKSFNEFFYRKLKPSARPIESPSDPRRLVSGADCRLMAFETVNDATRLWIKGREFTVARLLGPAYQKDAERYTGGALAIFRLAPQDYHRFHSPVDGTIGPMTYIAGEYYTVNPQAIRTRLDVYGENARKIVPIDSPQFGRVIAVCVGAMMVGSIKTTVQEGEAVKRGQEFGFFAFGGSTIVLLFEKGVVEWDEDLLVNGRAALETLVRVGMGIGRCRRHSA